MFIKIGRLEIVQNNFLRFLHFKETGTYSNTISTSFLRTKFKLFSLVTRREHADIFFLFKSLNNLIDSPSILSSIPFNVQPHVLRNNKLFFEPFFRTNLGKNSPINRITSLYNIRYANIDLFSYSLDTFRNIIKRQFEIY